MRKTTILAALALAGCATSNGASSDAMAPPPSAPPTQTAVVEQHRSNDPATSEKFDARAEARRYDHARDCELDARRLKEKNPDRGWKLLRACVDRGDFTEIRELLEGFWDEELRARKDAGELLTKLIAVRGGDIEGDVTLLHEHQVPVFTLADAMSQPDVYSGRLIIMRARPGELRAKNGAATVELTEYTHNANMVYTPVGPGFQVSHDYTHTSREGGHVETHHTKGATNYNKTDQRMATEDVETGRTALGKLAKADPFLEPDKDFIILARFENVRETADEGDGPGKLAVVSVIHYYRPASLALY